MMLEAPLGYKISFTFDMPDGTKFGGIISKADALYFIWQIYRGSNGTHLVITDDTFYKEDNELPEETQTPVRPTEA